MKVNFKKDLTGKTKKTFMILEYSKKRFLFIFICFLLIFSGCYLKKIKRIDTYKNIAYHVNPNPLEEIGGSVTFSITGILPKDFLNSNVIIHLFPVLRFENDSIVLDSIVLSKDAKDNIKESTHSVYFLKSYNISYRSELEVCALTLSSHVFIKKKKTVLDEIVIANGIVSKIKDCSQFIANQSYTVNPEFPGGEAFKMKFLHKNTKYPLAARENEVQGLVCASFYVEVDGSITNATILQGIGSGCDEEVLRIISIMPNWIPAELNGVRVRSLVVLPVRFILQ